jgi:membrane-bound lytic murein transglycosylase C
LWLSPALAIDFEDYDDDVAALLREYQSQSDSMGSFKPSVLSFNATVDSNTLVDFEKGLILVAATTPEMLRQSIIDVLLTQIDPSVIDAKTAQDFGLINEKTNRPFFWEQVLDNNGKAVESWRPAANFADYLLRQRTFDGGRFRVSITMVETHKSIAGSKYIKYAQSAGSQHEISVPLMMAIMETESSFNPLARSRSNALGLMQIKADTAGRDYFNLIKGYQHTPSRSFLYSAENNIEVAAGYLSILSNRYLKGIRDPKKLEYAVISSYNGGAGNLWRSLDRKGNKTKAIARINKMSTKDFYWFLTNRHIREETRNYVKKVTGKKTKYMNL